MKLMVTTSAFIAGAVIDEKTNKVIETDHWLAHLRGMSEGEFRQACQANRWAVSTVAEQK